MKLRDKVIALLGTLEETVDPRTLVSELNVLDLLDALASEGFTLVESKENEASHAYFEMVGQPPTNVLTVSDVVQES